MSSSNTPSYTLRGSIRAVTPTTQLKPGATHQFSVLFNNMDPCDLHYELTDWSSGTITDDGMYTAPTREGSFEIRIICKDNPEISTYVYVNVHE